MDSKDNITKDFLSRYGILTAGIIIYIILLGMCISQMRQSNKLATRNVTIKAIPEKIHFSLQADSLASNDTTLITALKADIDSLNFKIDSAIRLINTWNKLCDDNLLHGFDDLRQETNNVIDKQNGWLSFWIAILALVGALLPLLIQMNMQQDQRQKFEEEKEKIHSAIKETKKETKKAIRVIGGLKKTTQEFFEDTSNSLEFEINKHIKEQSEELENLKHDLRKDYDKDTKEINKELESLRSNRYYSEISKLSFTLIECSENILRIGDSKRNEYCNDLLIKLYKMTGLFFTTIAENDSLKNPNKINDLKIVLIQLLAAYNACKVLMTQKHRLKHLDEMTTNIGKILQNLYNDNNIDNQKLTDLLMQMESIQIV